MREDTNGGAPRRPATAEGASVRPFPTTGDLLALLGIFLAANLAVGVVAGVVRLALWGDSEPDPARAGRMLAATYAASMALTLGGVMLYRRLRGGRGPVARFSVRGLDPVLLGWAFALILAAGVVIEPLTARLPGPPYEAMGRGVWTFAALVVAAPLAEELLCRGIVLEAVRARRGAVAAWLASSLFFGVMHLYPAQAVGAFVIGLVLGFVCLSTGSLWGAVVLHAANNALAYCLMQAGYADLTLAEVVGRRGLYAAVYAAAAVLALLSAWRMRVALRRMDAAPDKNGEAA